MGTDEQRVRTMCGWIGVEISKSRVRTPDKPGYGLYRVRGGPWWLAGNALEPGPLDGWVSEEGEWTPYAFRLDVLERAVSNSIGQGSPAGPMDLAALRSDVGGMARGGMVHMRTRWTQAYRGRRDLGRSSVGEALEMPSTVRSRRRADNAAFQAEHQAARDHGLRARHAAKLSRNAAKGNGPTE